MVEAMDIMELGMEGMDQVIIRKTLVLVELVVCTSMMGDIVINIKDSQLGVETISIRVVGVEPVMVLMGLRRIERFQYCTEPSSMYSFLTLE